MLAPMAARTRIIFSNFVIFDFTFYSLLRCIFHCIHSIFVVEFFILRSSVLIETKCRQFVYSICSILIFSLVVFAFVGIPTTRYTRISMASCLYFIFQFLIVTFHRIYRMQEIRKHSGIC
jgi:hypothetical protein